MAFCNETVEGKFSANNAFCLFKKVLEVLQKHKQIPQLRNSSLRYRADRGPLLKMSAVKVKSDKDKSVTGL